MKTPPSGLKRKRGAKYSDIRPGPVKGYISETFIWPRVQVMTNRKSYMHYHINS